MQQMRDKKYRCVIDFIELEIETALATNAQTVRRKISLPYVKPLNKSLGAAATKFKFRIYDIEKWSDLENIYDSLNSHFKLRSIPEITAVEISFDTYMPGATPIEFYQQTALYFQMLKEPPSQNVRLSGPQVGSVKGMVHMEQIKNELERGKSIYIGSQQSIHGKPADNISMRLYYKTTDKGIALPSIDQRVRVEVTLQGIECPFATLGEAYEYNFTSLAKHFYQCQLSSESVLTPFVSRMPQIGMRCLVRRRAGGGWRKYRKSVSANTEINQIIYDKLRELTRRLKTSRGRKLRVTKDYIPSNLRNLANGSINYIH